MPQIRLALAQVDACVGDLEGNTSLALARCREAAETGAHLEVLAERGLVTVQEHDGVPHYTS